MPYRRRPKGDPLTDEERTRRFEAVALPHLNSAYNLARWLMKNDADAQDAVQQAYLRAFRYFGSFAGTEGRGWILTIVRRTCYDLLTGRKVRGAVIGLFDDEGAGRMANIPDPDPDPETRLVRRRDFDRINRLIAALPVEFREVIVLREIEDLSYREIATIAGIPIGTVMSRLARGRSLLRKAYLHLDAEETSHGV